MVKYSFKKAERLSHKTIIQELFDKGSSFYLHPFKILYLKQGNPEVTENRVMISVPKHNFKRAVDRNIIKRRFREGYRLNKSKITTTVFFSIAYIYTAKEILPSAIIHEKIILSLQKLGNSPGRESNQKSLRKEPSE